MLQDDNHIDLDSSSDLGPDQFSNLQLNENTVMEMSSTTNVTERFEDRK